MVLWLGLLKRTGRSNVYVQVELWPAGYPTEESLLEKFEVYATLDGLSFMWSLKREEAEGIVEAWDNSGLVRFQGFDHTWSVTVEPLNEILNPDKHMVISPVGGVFLYVVEKDGDVLVSAIREELTKVRR